VKRVITKELAVKIAGKLKAKKISSRKGAAHDLYDVEYQGILVAQFHIRHGSDRDQGHDFIPDQIHLRPNQAKRLGQCPLSLEQYYTILREKGLLPPEPEPPSTPADG
jgi:hypothetical protein